jgi:hypothetical protein
MKLNASELMTIIERAENERIALLMKSDFTNEDRVTDIHLKIRITAAKTELSISYGISYSN